MLFISNVGYFLTVDLHQGIIVFEQVKTCKIRVSMKNWNEMCVMSKI